MSLSFVLWVQKPLSLHLRSNDTVCENGSWDCGENDKTTTRECKVRNAGWFGFIFRLNIHSKGFETVNCGFSHPRLNVLICLLIVHSCLDLFFETVCVKKEMNVEVNG